MYYWPSAITIVDDTDRAEQLKPFLENLSWIVDSDRLPSNLIEDVNFISEKIDDLPEQIIQLATKTPEYFKDHVVAIKVFDETDIDIAVQRLKEAGSALAFIDFDYGFASRAESKFDELYNLLDRDWQIAESASVKGGCVFAAAFAPSLDNPVRLLCPTTYAPPRDVKKAAKEAITDHVPLQRGIPVLMEAVITALKRWVDIQRQVECPLDRIWEKTSLWFSENDLNDKGLPDVEHMPHHLPANISKDEKDFEQFVSSYKNVVQATIGLTLPDECWSSFKSLDVIHESLKHMCGYYYCGEAHIIDPDKNLSIGSAYLIALLAMREAGSYYPLSFEKIDDIHPGVYSSLFPLQAPEDARRGAKALYYLLLNLFRREEKHKKGGEIPKVESFRFLNNGRKLSFTFNWRANDKDNPSALSAQVKEALYLEETAHDPTYVKALDCIKDLTACMVRSKQGFGSPGSIWMNGNTLYIASNNTPAEVLIVCRNEDRYTPLVRLLLLTGINRVVILRGGEFRELNRFSIAYGGIPITQGEVPSTWTCVFIHTGDRDLLDNKQLTANKTFVFSAPGSPPNKAGELPIYRDTHPKFNISEQDVSEMLAYALGTSDVIPGCTQLKPSLDLLGTFFLLCQGYLSVYADPLTGLPDIEASNPAYITCYRALTAMGWPNFLSGKGRELLPVNIQDVNTRKELQREVNKHSWWSVFAGNNLLEEIRNEWGGEQPDGWSKVERLVKVISADSSNQYKPDIDLETVAHAYCAIADRLSANHCADN